MESYIGRLLDNRYEILEAIGTGGMAVVYRALDHRLNRPVAVKILKDELSKNQEFRRRFYAESQAVAMLSHPNIVSVYDVSRTGDADYIVMELIEGITLKQYLEKKGSLNWRETLHFSMQIAKALDHAHSRGIVHRDIKPHNIMILKDGSIKVADFGIARVGTAQNTLTREALGSVHYISPEQAKGARVDNRSDLYSLGVVMYEMLTGRTPYDGETPVAVAIQHINGGARRPSELATGIPAGLEQITLRAMAVNSDERYSSAAEMLRDMEEFRKNPQIVFPIGGAANSPQTEATPQTAEPQAEQLAQETPRGNSRSAMSRTDAERYAAARAGQSGSARTVEERRAERARREAALAEKKRRNTLIIAIAAAVAVLVFLGVMIGGALSGWFSGDTDSDRESDKQSDLIIVEDFVGLLWDDIKQSDYPDLKFEKKEDYSTEVEAGRIIKQDPAAGKEVKAGHKVTLTVSLGEQTEDMPNLRDETENSATQTLRNLDFGLKVKTEYEDDSDVKDGCVIRTEPEAGSRLSKGQEVILYICRWDDKMPDLRNMTKAGATERLQELSFSLKITFEEEESNEVEAGSVIRTVPEAGKKLSDGSTVTVYISLGSDKAKVPELSGKSLDSALAMLNAEELEYKINEVYDETVPKGYVISQSILPGEEVEKGTVIVIDVSLGPKPEESTEPPTESSTEAPTENSDTPTEESTDEPAPVGESDGNP